MSLHHASHGDYTKATFESYADLEKYNIGAYDELKELYPEEILNIHQVDFNLELYGKPFRIMAPKALDNSEEFIDSFNLGLELIIENGTYDKLHEDFETLIILLLNKLQLT